MRSKTARSRLNISSEEKENNFEDDSKISSYAKASGLISGREDNAFDPQALSVTGICNTYIK